MHSGKVCPDDDHAGVNHPRSFDVDKNAALFDPGRVGAHGLQHRGTHRRPGAVVEPPVVLGALDDISHDEAVAKQLPPMGAVPIRSEVLAVFRAIQGVFHAPVLEGNDVLYIYVLETASVYPGRHGSTP